MSKKLNLRTLLALIVIPPILLLAFIAAYGALVTFLGAGSAEQLKSDAQILSLVAVAGMLMSAAMVLVVGRRILEPINEVSGAARELADVRLPKLIESLSTPGTSMPQFDPLSVSGQTELAALGEALNSLQARAVTVANEQQRVVKEGISELVINLARRNQSLLDRQIETIDSLESTEEDPDRLESLFRLDHLATRMRRNAESLLVLAGAEPSRRRGGPVVLADVIRVAMSEIEDYQHVTMGEITGAHIGPQGAVDVAHLMSELLENATQFSPPEAPVHVSAGFDANGFYEIVVADRGIGMSAEQIAVANDLIKNPPELGLALTRSLGFQVIGRLAERMGIEVRLGHTDGGGTTAAVRIPASALSSGAAATVPAAFKSTPRPGSSGRSVAEQAVHGQSGRAVGAPVARSMPEPGPFDAPVAQPAPESPWAVEPSAPGPFEPAPPAQETPWTSDPGHHGTISADEFSSLLGGAPTRPQPAPEPIYEPPPVAADQPFGDTPQWQAPAGPTPGSPPASMDQAMPTGAAFHQGVDALLDDPSHRTTSGLVRRDRSKNHAPASEGRALPGSDAGPVAASSRSPEEIRNMLARYRDGLKGRPDGGGH